MVVRAVRGPVSKSGRSRIGTAEKVRGASTPAPTRGWNARDSIAEMEPADAIVLDNWFPQETNVRVRRGNTAHATGIGSSDAVETLMSWNGPTSAELFAVANGSLYDVTSSGAVGGALVSGLTNARFQHTMFGISSGSYLVAVNGADPMLVYGGGFWLPVNTTSVYTLAYDGGTGAFVVGETVTGAGGASGTIKNISGDTTSGTLVIDATSGLSFVNDEVLTGSIAGAAVANGIETQVLGGLTGIATSSLISVFSFKGRLIFIEKDSLSFWYLPIEQVTGAATEFDLGPRARLGGYLVAGGTWTRDGGDGPDDLAVFLTSEGEAIVYAGTDPGSIDTWALVGVYRIGAPLGRRCLMRLGPDLAVMTEDGFGTLSRFIQGARVSDKAALSDRISGAVNSALSVISTPRTAFGFQAVHYPAGDKIIFNIPLSESQQFVSNATTGAWCRFTGWDANCWELSGDNLYFGGAGTVYQADTGEDDNGTAIDADLRTAFSYFGSRGVEKRFAMVRPVFEAEGSIFPALRVNVDFADLAPEGGTAFEPSTAAVWDDEDWDAASWGGLEIILSWKSVNGIGVAASLALGVTLSAGSVYLNAVDWKIEPSRGAGYI